MSHNIEYSIDLSGIFVIIDSSQFTLYPPVSIVS